MQAERGNAHCATVSSSPSSLLPDFHRVGLLFYKKYFINLFFALIRLLQKIMHFKVKQTSFFNFILVGFDFAVFCICVS